MAPKPYIFESRKRLIEELQSKHTQYLVDDLYNNKTSLDVIIKECVQANTFRAFRKSPNENRPSVVFRKRCKSYFTDGNISKLINARDKYQYQLLFDKAVSEFRQYWKSEMLCELDYGRAAKLLNLFFKHLARFHKLTNTQKNNLINLQHVPLDSYTIRGLQKIAPDLQIKSNDSMSSIGDSKRYLQFQHLISEIAKEANIPAIYYDFVAWDKSHREG